jgi:hypothetical protein
VNEPRNCSESVRTESHIDAKSACRFATRSRPHRQTRSAHSRQSRATPGPNEPAIDLSAADERSITSGRLPYGHADGMGQIRSEVIARVRITVAGSPTGLVR